MKHTLTLLGMLWASLCLSQGAYQSQQDTIFIEFDAYGQKLFQHEMAENETLYSLSRFFGLQLEELYNYNPQLIQNTWDIGQKVWVPLSNRCIIRYPSNQIEIKDAPPIVYRAKAGDTMYGIAKTQFKMPVDDLLVRNNLENHVLSLGQELLLGWFVPKPPSNTPYVYYTDPRFARSNSLGKFYEKGKGDKTEKYEQGIAYWQKNGDMGSDLYALHRTAPINSVLSILNPMTERTVYAKVMGRLPENVYPDKVMVVISPKVANLLGALDGQFFVKVRYLR